MDPWGIYYWHSEESGFRFPGGKRLGITLVYGVFKMGQLTLWIFIEVFALLCQRAGFVKHWGIRVRHHCHSRRDGKISCPDSHSSIGISISNNNLMLLLCTGSTWRMGGFRLIFISELSLMAGLERREKRNVCVLPGYVPLGW